MQFVRVIPFLIVLAVVLASGLRPEPIPQLFNQQDKLHHLLGFAAFAFTMRLAFPRLHFGWTLLVSVLAAFSIEIAQGALPHRTPSWGDMLANLLGVFCGWAVSVPAAMWLRRRQQRLPGAEAVTPA